MGKINKKTSALIVIPAYNEAQNIERVVDELIHEYPQYDYIIINDCSTDDTKEVCEKNNYNILNLPLNTGLGTVVQTGFKYALRNNYDYVIQYDGDGQHNARYIEDLLKEAQKGTNIVIGSRFIDEKKGYSLRNMGSRVITTSISMLTNVTLTDPTSGFKCYDKIALNHYVKKMNVAPEADDLVYLIKKKNLKVKEIPVKMNERLHGESYFNIFTSCKFMVNMLVSIFCVQLFRRD